MITQHTLPRLLMTAALGLVLACDGTIREPGDPLTDEEIDAELTGAGGRDLTEFWPEIAIPFSNNTKMLTFDMLKNEVVRATTLSWVENGEDQWEANRTALGGADYVRSFTENRTPSQQKLVTVRKMAFSVCGELVANEAGQAERVVFDIVDPGAAIEAGSAEARKQVESMFGRFFYSAPAEIEITESLALLDKLQASDGAGEAWRGLCAAYLSSMRFLSY